jgi:hypothetical protein
LYSANGFYKNKYGIVQTLQYNTNKNKAIVPPMKWLDSIAPKKPIVSATNTTAATMQLQLKHTSIDANCFVIYKFAKNEKVDIADASKIEAITNTAMYNTKFSAIDFKYVVTSLDKIHNESDYVIVQ